MCEAAAKEEEGSTGRGAPCATLSILSPESPGDDIHTPQLARARYSTHQAGRSRQGSQRGSEHPTPQPSRLPPRRPCRAAKAELESNMNIYL